MVEVASGRRDTAVAELLGDDPDIHAFGAEPGVVRVAKAVCVDTFVDPGHAPKPRQEHAHIGVARSTAGECAEDRAGAVHAQFGPDHQPAFDDRPGRRGLLWSKPNVMAMVTSVMTQASAIHAIQGWPALGIEWIGVGIGCGFVAAT